MLINPHQLFGAMAKLLLVRTVVILGLALACKAAMYTVGDSSGWDISTDLDTWVKDKRFAVGDVLLFQYSSSESVNEVTKENYDGCNTTNVVQSFSNGNTTVPLTKPGDRYFVCGNKLYCLGGMKLHVKVDGAQGAPSPGASAPQSESGAGINPTNTPSSKSNKPPTVVSSSSAVLVSGGVGSLVFVFVGLMAPLLLSGV